MKRLLGLVPLLLLVFAFLAAPAASAQTAKEMKPPTATVALYRVAPGKHLEFLKWMAENDAIDKEAVPVRSMHRGQLGLPAIAPV
jgi:hypothetical protein